MPHATKTIALSQPVEAFGKRVTALTLRAPTAAQFFALGPLTTNFAKSGVVSAHDLEGVLLAYLQGGCILDVDPSSVALMLADLPLVDGVRIRRTFAGFFDEAIEAVLLAEAAEAATASPAPVA